MRLVVQEAKGSTEMLDAVLARFTEELGERGVVGDTELMEPHFIPALIHAAEEVGGMVVRIGADRMVIDFTGVGKELDPHARGQYIEDGRGD